MKSLILGALLTGFWPSNMKATEPRALDVDRLLECICQVENGSWGSDGGRANIHFEAWSDSSDLSYLGSRTKELAWPVYRKHILEKIIPQLKAVGCRVNPQTIGSCWRLGFTGARRHGFKTSEGERISNLYFSDFKP